MDSSKKETPTLASDASETPAMPAVPEPAPVASDSAGNSDGDGNGNGNGNGDMLTPEPHPSTDEATALSWHASSFMPGGSFPVAGLGASAGGLAAFEAFFSGMPVDEQPGMAFVLIQHLAPDHKSLLAELMRRCTRMPVFEVEDGMVVQPNCVYVIPPSYDMAFFNGMLQLLEPMAPRGQRMPIDFFFRSLAQDQHERAIGIVLSGTGSDGTLGLRAIKAEGGLAMAQNPESADFDGMPRAALATGLIDYELPPPEMVPQLMAYVAHAFGRLGRGRSGRAVKSENELKKIFILLRAHTGHDFSQYKPSTIHRRIDRRMAVQQIE
ncbi:chemotaxis protein CheB, partial [Roseateles sp. GG27B]